MERVKRILKRRENAQRKQAIKRAKEVWTSRNIFSGRMATLTRLLKKGKVLDPVFTVCIKKHSASGQTMQRNGDVQFLVGVQLSRLNIPRLKL